VTKKNPFKISLVQPLTHHPDEDDKNVAEAVKYIERAALDGAAFVCFPENYPGPWRMPMHFDPNKAISDAARKNKIYVIFGTLEPIDETKKTAYNLISMAYPDGKIVSYRRSHPRGPWIYTGGKDWEFQYVAGDDFSVFDTEYGKVGLAMCSEIYIPEVTRALALRGAELIFMPAGANKFTQWETWRVCVWARAIENLAVVVTTQNIFNNSEPGLAMIASPERILFESSLIGQSLVDIDLERIRYLRTADDLQPGTPGASNVKHGLLDDGWQRPELYKKIYSFD
jgi:predicted amidohydrolase